MVRGWNPAFWDTPDEITRRYQTSGHILAQYDGNMLYPATRTDLKNILQWLRGQDESQWEEQTTVLSDTIAVFKELSRPIPHLNRLPNAGRDVYSFPALPAGINDAMPYLRGMLEAMGVRNRQDALDYGEAALGLLLPE